MASKQLNVLKTPLALLSKDPITGFYRNGYCQVGPDDSGNHAVAATLTSSFLKFSASRGNDLTQIGLKDGCKWCLCAARWKEAAEHAKSLPEGSKEREGLVPRVHLESTNESALRSIAIDDLKRFAAEK